MIGFIGNNDSVFACNQRDIVQDVFIITYNKKMMPDWQQNH